MFGMNPMMAMFDDGYINKKEEAMGKRPWVGCCDKMKRSRFAISRVIKDGEKPVWMWPVPMMSWSYSYFHYASPGSMKDGGYEEIDELATIEHCPYCATKLPDFKRKEGLKVAVDGKDGMCETCKGRIVYSDFDNDGIHRCECANPEEGWEIVE